MKPYVSSLREEPENCRIPAVVALEVKPLAAVCTSCLEKRVDMLTPYYTLLR